MVQDATRAVAPLPRQLRRARLVAAIGLAAAALAGCGGSGSADQAPQVGPNVGAPINLADCDDWKQASIDQRIGTIRQLENFAGGPVVGGSAEQPSGRGAVLDQDKAYELLDNYCKNEFARGFKLYKLYQRAAAFSGTPPQ